MSGKKLALVLGTGALGVLLCMLSGKVLLAALWAGTLGFYGLGWLGERKGWI